MLLDSLHNREQPGPIDFAATNQGMPWDQYDELCAAFPPLFDRAPEGHLGSARAQAAHFMDDPALPQVWRAFWEEHLTSAFVARSLGFWAAKLHTQVAELNPYKTHIRGVGNAEDYDLEVEGQFVHNVAGARGLAPHRDSAYSIVFFLWYFRGPEDRGEGGELTFYRTDENTQYDHKRRSPITPVAPLHVVPYAANTLVMVKNSAAAVHGVSPWLGKALRRNVGLTIEISRKDFKLFDRS